MADKYTNDQGTAKPEPETGGAGGTPVAPDATPTDEQEKIARSVDSDKPTEESVTATAAPPESTPESTPEAAADADADADAEDEKPKQTVTIEDVGPARKRLTIEVPAERIGSLIDDNFDKLQDQAAIPGFRRGRAPKRLIEKRFGSSIRDEVRDQLLSEAYSQAIEDEKIEVVGQPEIMDQDDIKLPDDGPLTFKVEIEVVPEFDLPDLEGIEIERRTFEVTDADIDKEIERDCERFGSFSDVFDELQPGDFLQADVHVLPGDGKDEDAEEIDHNPMAYVLVPGEASEGKGHINGIVIEKLDEKLKGKKVGDELVISMNGPAGHENEKIKNQPITIKARIDKVERVEPVTPEELAERYGMVSVDEMKDTIRRIVEDRALRDQRSDMHAQVIDFLMEKIDFETPKDMTEHQASRMLHREAMEMAYRGATEEEIEQAVAEMREDSTEEAAKGLKEYFILEKAAKSLDIDVSENEMNGRIAMIAMQQGRRPEKLRQEMYRSGQIEQLFVHIRDQKTLDQIIDNAKVTDVEAETQAPDADEKPKQPDGEQKSAAIKADEGDKKDDPR